MLLAQLAKPSEVINDRAAVIVAVSKELKEVVKVAVLSNSPVEVVEPTD